VCQGRKTRWCRCRLPRGAALTVGKGKGKGDTGVGVCVFSIRACLLLVAQYISTAQSEGRTLSSACCVSKIPLGCFRSRSALSVSRARAKKTRRVFLFCQLYVQDYVYFCFGALAVVAYLAPSNHQ